MAKVTQLRICRGGIQTEVSAPRASVLTSTCAVVWGAAAVTNSTLRDILGSLCRGSSILHHGRLALASLLLVFAFQLIQCILLLSLLLLGKNYYDFKSIPGLIWTYHGTLDELFLSLTLSFSLLATSWE